MMIGFPGLGLILIDDLAVEPNKRLEDTGFAF
jgi:hypothetical protein